MSKSSIAWRVLGMCVLRDSLFFIPVVVAYYGMKGADLAGILLIQGIFKVGILVLEVPMGFLADRWSRKQQLVLSCTMWLLSLLVLLGATTFGGLVLAELIGAVACTMRSGTVEAYLYEALVAEGRAEESRKWQGWLFAGSRLGEMVAAIVGGWLFSMWVDGPVVVTAIGAVGSVWLALSLPQIHRRGQPRHTNPVKDLALILRWSFREHPRLPWLLAGPPVLFGYTSVVFWGTLGRFAELGITAEMLGVTLAGLMFLKAMMALGADWIIIRLGGEHRLVILLPLLLVVGVLLLVLCQSPWLVWLGCVLSAGAVHAIGRPYAVCFINREVIDAERATVISVGALVASVIGAVMMLIAEPLLSIISLGQFLLGCLVVTLLLAGYPLYRLAK